MAHTLGPHPIDLHVGERVRLRRKQLGVSQQTLAGWLGLTFQQVQKYESGANRISASRLHETGRALDVPVSFFFEGLNDPDASQPEHPVQARSRTLEHLLTEPNGLALAEAYLRIPRRRIRKAIADFARAMAGSYQEGMPDGRPAEE